MLLALRAVLYMAGFVLLWGWLALTVRAADHRLGGPLPRWLQGFGLWLMVLGASLALVCGAVFVLRGRGTPAPFDAPRDFVAVGPYRWTRNPMYIGGLGLLLGVGLWLSSPAIVVLSAVAWGLAHAFVVAYEEPTLRRRFGTSYEEYTRRVHRWLPARPLKQPPGST